MIQWVENSFSPLSVSIQALRHFDMRIIEFKPLNKHH